MTESLDEQGLDPLDEMQAALGLPVGVRVESLCLPPCRVCDDVQRFVELAYGAVVLRERASAGGQATLAEVFVGP